MDYILACISIEDNPVRLYLITAVVILLFNCLWAFLDRLLLPWQAKKLLKKWKIGIKDTGKLPLLAQLKDLVVNLSGTISYGAPAVTDIFPNGISSGRLLALAAAIEKGIDHPIAEAIVDEASVRGLALPEISAASPVPGKGVEALMNRQTLSLGSAKFLQEQNIDIPAELFTRADQLAYKGQIIVFVAIGKFCRGFITLHDKIKRSVPGDISFLREMGITTTGLDNLIKASYELLGLISFLTDGKKECRAWTIRKGTKAPQAAGKIHSDFERGFIRASVIGWKDLEAADFDYAAVKAKGQQRTEGKEYVVQDGDVIEFLFNV